MRDVSTRPKRRSTTPGRRYRCQISGILVGTTSVGRLWASSKAGDKPDQITAIVQFLVIDWLIAGRVRRALDQQDRAADRYFERLGGNGVGRRRFQLVFSFEQRGFVLVF